MIVIETTRSNSDQACFNSSTYTHAVVHNTMNFNENKLHVCDKL